MARGASDHSTDLAAVLFLLAWRAAWQIDVDLAASDQTCLYLNSLDRFMHAANAFAKRSPLFAWPIAIALLWIATICLPGCTKSTGVTGEADLASGQRLLEGVLEKWKQGEKIASNNDVVVGDYQWEANWRLEKYTIEPGVSYSSDSMLFPVKLQLVDPKGTSKEEAAQYVVGTSPKVTVIRQ
jgi:hypothetical protein